MRIIYGLSILLFCKNLVSMDQKLFDAAAEGNIELIKLLCQEEVISVAPEPLPGVSPCFPWCLPARRLHQKRSALYNLPRFSQKSEWYNAARIAALSEHPEVVEHVFEKKCLELCAVDKDGQTIWAYAARKKCVKTIAWLMEYLKKSKSGVDGFECAICLDELTAPVVCDYYCLTAVCDICKRTLKKEAKCPSCRRPMSDA